MKRSASRYALAAAAALLFFTIPSFADVVMLAPGVASNAGLPELAQAFTKKTGIKVTIKGDGMTTIVRNFNTAEPAPDIAAVPDAFMDGMEANSHIKPGSRVEMGRVYVGLAVKKGAPHPDISTPAKLAAALKAGGTIMVSNPEGGSMEARVINDMLHLPMFKGVKMKISLKGEGGEALVRGEGDMALQLSCEILNHPELEQVGLVPEELRAFIDVALAISPRSANADQAAQFIAYVKSPEGAAVLKAKGMVPAP
ncbi:MAG TPA: substrate-binding domain-containing protein [Rhizomicrobium sp.]|nr:substrate-binding domain-containing protein [Rhizomicrobium sp.]HWC63197.1 substrate-binding domain-containing protein [Rhizomicrobium sp.]